MKKLSQYIDEKNREFTLLFKSKLAVLSEISDEYLEWLTMEHYQFSFANKELLQRAVAATVALSEKGVSAELLRNLNEEDGHAPMYKRGMLAVGTDFDKRQLFEPTERFLDSLRDLLRSSPSAVLGALYATETAAIFEHEVFFDICHEICARRNAPWEGSVIKHFHDIHLSEGVEQGHKDGLAIFVDFDDAIGSMNERQAVPLNKVQIYSGALKAISAMHEWWSVLLSRKTLRRDPDLPIAA